LEIEDPAQEVKRLKRCINDVLSVVALPAMWAGSEPPQIVRTLVDVLLGVLDLDLVYALLKGANGEPLIEMARVSSVWERALQPQEVGAVLHKLLGDNPQEWPGVVRKPFQERDMSIVPLRLGLHYEFGLIVAGSQRTDFPQQTESLILNVASNQAAIELQEAHILSEQKKIAHELERQVAERTACIAAANEDLRKEIADRKEAEEKLRRSEADLLEAQRLTQTCSWKHDIPSGRVSVTPEALRMFGVTSDEDTSDPRCWFDKQHPEDRLRSQSVFEKCEAEKTPYEDDYRIVLPDGSIRYLHSVGRPVLNGSGELVEFIGTAIDVTEQVQARAALQKAFDEIEKSEAKLRQVIDTIPALGWSARPDGSAEFFNRPWLEYAGLSYDQARDFGWVKAVHPDDLNRLMEYWRSILASGEPGETEARLRRFDGEYRWFLFRANPLRDKSGTVVKWYGTNVDIEDRKRAEEILRQSEESLRTIRDTIRQPIVVLAPDGTLLSANRVALDLTGFTMAEVNGKDFFIRIFHPDDIERFRAERQEQLLLGTPFELEARLLTSGQYRWWLLQYNPFKDERGQVIRWYATATDIDDQKRTEERLRNENLVLREEIDRSSMFEEIVGSCKPMRQVLNQVEKVAPSDSTVLILGETGTGKELIARALHRRSKRATRSFVRVNCAAIPQSLIASELFGHEKGAFTGALQRRVGRFEAADGGTLFLDEIGDLPMETQIALLRVLQEKEFERVGSNHPISVDVRLIAATNRDLPSAVAAGTFRHDLFYRLNVFPIAVPPLREREEDIPLLVEYFVGRLAKGAGKNIRHIGKDTLEQLKGYRWPGNIRELQNVVERAVILSETDNFVVDESWLQRESADSSAHEALSALAGHEVEMIETALAESHGRISGPSGAAAKLGIPRQTLESKIRRLGIDKYGQKRSTSK
jgi:formate hydrogenlyase transcriptional activator